jgi:D-alanyl-D-alanine carboxypeptidase
MPKNRPQEEEQSEYSRPGPRYNGPYRRPTGNSRRPRQSYLDDEHPEIPRIRRASLYLDDYTYPSRPQDRPTRPTRTNRLLDKYDDDEIALPPERPTLTKSSTKRPIRQRSIDEDQEAWSDRAEIPRSMDKITVTQRKRSNIYEPPPLARPRIHKRNKIAASFLQNSRQRRMWLLVGITSLLTLICLSLISSALTGNNSITFLTGNTSQSNAGSGTSVQSANPHQIAITPSDTTHPAPPVYAASAYLLDAKTGATLYAHNPFEHLSMLSTTKLMTALLAMEHGNLDQNITINAQMANDVNNLAADSSLMGVKKGETYTLRDLLYGAMLASGNDAATVIADAIGGTEQNFVAMMNQRAHQLGLNDTHYMNPHGLLTDGHYSCAHDLAVLGKYVMANAALRQIVGTREYKIPATSQHTAHDLFNGNQFLWWYPGADGVKPGYDGDTDFIQVVSVTHNGHELIGVTMDTIDWWTDMRDLMNWGFDSFTWVSPYNVDFQHPIPYDNLWNFFVKDKQDITVPTPDKGRYYVYSGYSISGPIMQYFDKKGGLRQFGYPESMPAMINDTVVAERFDHGSIQCDTTSKVCKQA